MKIIGSLKRCWVRVGVESHAELRRDVAPCVAVIRTTVSTSHAAQNTAPLFDMRLVQTLSEAFEISTRNSTAA